MISQTVIELSRWQFAITAMSHFLFIPLTLGLALLLALMESVYVWSGRELYKEMALFWGRIFAVNFVLAVTTRLLVIFQFGMQGPYFSHYVGDIFALPLAIEGSTSFFLAAAFFGPYRFGWDKFKPKHHLLLTWLIAIAVNISAYWVLLANGWLQNPVGADFNYQSYRMELSDFNLLLTNPAAMYKYWHTVAACYVVSTATLIAISAYWLKRDPRDQVGRMTYKLAAGFGSIAIIVTVALGDHTPNLDNTVQKAKHAVIFGAVDKNVSAEIDARIRSGIKAYELLQQLRDGNKDQQLLADFGRHKADLGYALFLTPIHRQIVGASDKQIALAASSVLPAYPGLLFWAYWAMIVCGVVSLLSFMLASWGSFIKKDFPVWLLKANIYLASVPWVAVVLGWFVAEAGKQPWAIAGILPTFLSVSSRSVTELVISAIAYALACSLLLVLGLFLMRQTIANKRVIVCGGE